jgi:RND family efflux transporter MFP subunit
MNIEGKPEITEADVPESDESQDKQQKSSRRPIYIAAAIIGVVVVGALAIWFFRNRESGQIVPAPRGVTFDNSNSSGVLPGEATITLSPEQIEHANIKTETVGEQLSTEGGTALTTGVIQANAYRETPVISLVGGIVRRVNAELGQQVAKGQTVAVVFSEEFSQAESRYLTLLKEAETSRQNYAREARLVKISPVSNAELDEAAKNLKTAEAELDEHHKHHMRTAKLLEIGASSREEFEMATTKLQTAEANVQEARNRYERAVQVAEINPVNQASFEQAAVKLRTAESDLASMRERLLLLGLSQQKIDALQSPKQISAELALTAPVSGTVTDRSVNAGEVVEANKELIKVTDLSSVWAIAQVYENDLSKIRIGSGATVTSNSYPNQVFRGHITYIDPNINQETRTVQARVELDNPGQSLKIGMYVNVAFAGLGEAERTIPVVPSAAVQNLNNQQVVFIATDNPNTFIMRSVKLEPENSGLYPVIEGLTVGDKVVTDGSFLLRAEWLKLHPGIS